MACSAEEAYDSRKVRAPEDTYHKELVDSNLLELLLVATDSLRHSREVVACEGLEAKHRQLKGAATSEGPGLAA